MSRNRRQQRPTVPEPTRAPIGTTEARDLAADLIRELAQHAGDPDAVRTVLLQWLTREDHDRLSMVAMSAVQIMFADCLTRTPLGAWTLNPPPERKP